MKKRTIFSKAKVTLCLLVGFFIILFLVELAYFLFIQPLEMAMILKVLINSVMVFITYYIYNELVKSRANVLKKPENEKTDK